MKRFRFQLLLGALAMLTTLQVSAQDKPAPSPLGKVYQRVGVTDIEVAYSRPGVKGRTIFASDGLTPFGKLWRTGANRATKISFSTDVMIGGKKVAAGDYAIFSIPGEKEWTFIINSEPNQGGTGNYKEAQDVVRLTAQAQDFPGPVESMTFVFSDVKDTSANLVLVWENTMVGFPIEVEKTW